MPRQTDALPFIGEIVCNLMELRELATPDIIAEGRDWYPSNARMIAQIATDASVTAHQAAGVFAAFSQNATWRANVTMATNYLFGHPRGMKSVLAEADAIMDGAGPDILLGKSGQSKRPDFWRNLAGDTNYVTCDRWHLRAAFNPGQYDDSPADLPSYISRNKKYAGYSIALTPEVRELVTAATRIVASRYDEAPSACQAVIWCVMRGTGE